MNQNEVLAKLQEVFDEMFVDPVEVHPGLTARDVPEWDSLMQIPLMISVERAFNIRFKVGEAATARNVGELADMIVRKVADG